MNAYRVFIMTAIAQLLLQSEVFAGDYSTTLAKKSVERDDGFVRPVTRVELVRDQNCDSAEKKFAPSDCRVLTIKSLSGGGVTSGPVISAGLPHLHVDFLWQRVEHQAVSGGGIDVIPEDGLVATSEIAASSPADNAPEEEGGPYGYAIPTVPGEVFDFEDTYHGNGIYSGSISNGCSPTTEVDFNLHGTVSAFGNDMISGEVDLQDQTVGHGFYTYSYTIRASDGEGGVSDFIFSGDVNVYCSAQDSP